MSLGCLVANHGKPPSILPDPADSLELPKHPSEFSFFLPNCGFSCVHEMFQPSSVSLKLQHGHLAGK